MNASYSKLKRLKISPAHVLIEQQQSRAMLLGTAFHQYVLQPEKFKENFIIFDDSKKVAEIGGGNPRATNVYKQWLQELPLDKERLTLAETAHFEPIKQKLHKDSFYKYIMRNLYIEHKIEFEYMGVKFASIPDIVNTKKQVIIDIKTCQSAKADNFKKDAAKFDYHLQAAIYIEACKQLYGEGDWTVMFLACETSEPYLFQWFQADEQFISVGKQWMDILTILWKDCLENGFNRGYEIFCQDKKNIETLSLPAWKLAENIDFYQ